MKAIVTERGERAPHYPRLMQCGSTIVLFAAARIGTVVKSDNYKIGRHDVDWAMDQFRPFTGSVTLSNE